MLRITSILITLLAYDYGTINRRRIAAYYRRLERPMLRANSFVMAAILLCGLSLSMPAQAQFAALQAAKVVPDVICNLATGVATGTGAGTCIASPPVCNGVADDSTGVTAFRNWAVNTWQASHTGLVELFVPSGLTCLINSGAVCGWNSNTSCPFYGIKRLMISGYGSRFLFGSGIISIGTGAGRNSGQANQSARLVSAAAGDTCVTLVTSGNSSFFTAGQYVQIGGWDQQGLWQAGGFGDPANLYFYEWHKVSTLDASKNCDGVTNGASLHLSGPLAHAYLSTWPCYDNGVGGTGGPNCPGGLATDQGGPATAFTVDAGWDSEVEFDGLSMEETAQQMNPRARISVFKDVTFTGGNCAIPSFAQVQTLINVTATPSCNLEVDKIVGTLNVVNSQNHIITYQSGSPQVTNYVGGSVTTLSGNGQKTWANGTSFNSMQVGVPSYGSGTTFNCLNCSITTFNYTSSNQSGTISGGNWSLSNQTGSHFTLTMSGGVITVPNTYGSVTWVVPGSNAFWTSAQDNEYGFNIVSVTQDATNTYLTTNLAGGFPTIPLSGNGFNVHAHPAPVFSCTGCTGTAGTPMALWPANRPLYSYAKATFDGSIGTTAGSGFYLWGNVSSIDLNVTNAYSGAGALAFNVTQFFNWPIVNSAGSLVSWNNASSGPAVNGKSVGDRLIQRSGVTCQSGTCTGDVGMTLPDATTSYLTGGSNAGPQWSANVSGSCPGAGCPSITVTIQTDQGLVAGP